MTTEIILLLIAFQIKHFLCDYPLQTQYMLRKGSRTGWVPPLLAHASCHGFVTGLIALICCALTSGGWGLILSVMLLDFVVHFTVDRIKAHPDLGGKFENTSPKFWWCLGADQMCHHLTHYVIIWILVS